MLPQGGGAYSLIYIYIENLKKKFSETTGQILLAHLAQSAKVSFWDDPLSVVRRRRRRRHRHPSSVVRRQQFT